MMIILNFHVCKAVDSKKMHFRTSDRPNLMEIKFFLLVDLQTLAQYFLQHESGATTVNCDLSSCWFSSDPYICCHLLWCRCCSPCWTRGRNEVTFIQASSVLLVAYHDSLVHLTKKSYVLEAHTKWQNFEPTSPYDRDFGPTETLVNLYARS